MAKKNEEKNSTILQYAVGRRKRSVAKVRMFAGKGQILINDKPAKDFVQTSYDYSQLMKALEAVGMTDDHDFTVKVIGGGLTGQMEAAAHGIARCIAKINDDMKRTMSTGGFLTRDPREKERKKVYHLRARKSPQFSKR